MSDWRPACAREMLRERGELLAAIRSFFAESGVLEVETPLLSSATVTDPAIESVQVVGHADANRYLQTSPEFAMKRLLASGSGDIYQITRAFRGGERGRLHNVEFALLEWYRIGWDHYRLMDEVSELLSSVGGAAQAERVSYRSAFEQHVGLDPLVECDEALRDRTASLGVVKPSGLDRNSCLDLIFTSAVQPQLGLEAPCLLYDYPASQAALARIRSDEGTAERFELFWKGIELANGYHELTDTGEQRARFVRDNARRRQLGLPVMPIDDRLLAALGHGLPACAGVALGLDRLLMAMRGAAHIDEVLPFPEERA